MFVKALQNTYSMPIPYGNRFGNKNYFALFKLWCFFTVKLALLLQDCNFCTSVYPFNASFPGNFSQYYSIQGEFWDFSGELHFPEGGGRTFEGWLLLFFLKK